MDMQTQGGPTMVALPLHVIQEIAGFRIPVPPAGAPLGMEANQAQAARQALQGMPVRDSGGPVTAGQPFLSGRDDETEVTDSGKTMPVDPGVNVPQESGTVLTPQERSLAGMGNGVPLSSSTQAANPQSQLSMFQPPTESAKNPAPYSQLQDFQSTADRAGLPASNASAMLSSFQRRSDPSQSPETDTTKQDPAQAGATAAKIAPPQFEHAAFDQLKTATSAIQPGGEFDPANAPQMNKVHGARRVLADIAGVGLGLLTGSPQAGMGIHNLIEDPGYRQRLSDFEQRRQAAVAGIAPLERAADIERLRNNELQVGYNNAETQATNAAKLAEQQRHHQETEKSYQDRIAAIQFAAGNTQAGIARQAVDAEMAKRGKTAQSDPELYLSLYDQAIKQVKPPTQPRAGAAAAATTNREYLTKKADLEAAKTKAYQGISTYIAKHWPNIDTGRDKYGLVIDPVTLANDRQAAAQYAAQQRAQIDADYQAEGDKIDRIYGHAPAAQPPPKQHQPPPPKQKPAITMDGVKQYASLAGISPAQATQIYIKRGYNITQ